MQPRNRDMTFTVFPAGSAGPTAHFVAELRRALNEIGSTRLITRTTAEEAFGRGEISDSALSSWLNEQESKFKFLIYEADPGPTAWTSRCVRRADRVLAVAHLENGRALNEIEVELDYTARGSLRSHAQVDLVLLHSDESLPSGSTPEWL